MVDLFHRSPQRVAVSVFNLTVQLDEQLYARLYGIRPLSYDGRLRLFCFSFVTCLTNCAAELGQDMALIKTRMVDLCIDYLLDHYELYFAAAPEPDELKATFTCIASQYELGWKMAAMRLDGSQASQGHAVIRRSFNQILYDDPTDKGHEALVMNQVHDLVEALPRLRAAL